MKELYEKMDYELKILKAKNKTKPQQRK